MPSVDLRALVVGLRQQSQGNVYACCRELLSHLACNEFVNQPRARRKFPIELSGSSMPAEFRTASPDPRIAQTYCRPCLACRKDTFVKWHRLYECVRRVRSPHAGTKRSGPGAVPLKSDQNSLTQNLRSHSFVMALLSDGLRKVGRDIRVTNYSLNFHQRALGRLWNRSSAVVTVVRRADRRARPYQLVTRRLGRVIMFADAQPTLWKWAQE
jgi:hypothetical protein